MKIKNIVFILLGYLSLNTLFANNALEYSPIRYNVEMMDISEKEMECLAKNIYFESKNQNDYGKFAVANVTLNRVRNPAFPDTICRVVFQASRIPQKRHLCQFSWWCDGKPDRIRDLKAWDRCRDIAILAILHKDKDITLGATHYHADYVRPWWAKRLLRTVKIGSHIFYKET